MCRLPSSPTSCGSNSDQPNLIPSTKLQVPDIRIHLIPKTPTHEHEHQNQQGPQKTHLSLAVSEANCIARIAFPMVLTGLLLYLRSMIPKTPTHVPEHEHEHEHQNQQEPQKTHLSLAVSEANCIARIAFPMVLTGLLLYIPINYFLVFVLKLGINGVALSGVWTNFNLVGSLIVYIIMSKVYEKTWVGISTECFKGWKSLLNLAIPSCISVCLEWWWYEIMILLCGLLLNPEATVASMGVLIQTTALIYIFPSSLSFGVSTRVGNELGANNQKKARLAAIVGLSFSFTLGFSALVYLVGMPVAVWLSFYAGFDFKGLWLGLLAAQGSCVVTMLFVLCRTDWERQTQRAKELTETTTTIDDDNQEAERLKDSCFSSFDHNVESHNSPV